MTEIHEYNMALHSVGRKSEAIPLSVVVSLGTGMPPVIEQKEIDIFRPAGLMDMQRSVSGIMSILNLLVDQATLSDGRVVDRARAWCSMNGISYFRFNPQLSEDLAMDEKLEAPVSLKQRNFNYDKNGLLISLIACKHDVGNEVLYAQKS